MQSPPRLRIPLTMRLVVHRIGNDHHHHADPARVRAVRSAPRAHGCAASDFKGISMSLKCGIVGLPNVGKSTLFNALTKAGIAAENYPF